MVANPQIFSRDEHDTHKHLRAVVRREQLAAVREQDGGFPTAQAIAHTYSHTTAAANHLLAGFRCVYKYRHLVDVLVGLAAGRTGWFEATDDEIARAAGRSKKWVQETRRDFIAWQKRHNVGIVDVEDHKYRVGETPTPHKYRVHLALAAAEATLDALTSAGFDANPAKALRDAAVDVRSSLPNAATHKTHGRQGERRDPEALASTKLRTAATNIRRACDLKTATGAEVVFDREALAELKAAIALLETRQSATLTNEPVKTKKRVAHSFAVVGRDSRTGEMGERVEKSSTTPTNYEVNQQDTGGTEFDDAGFEFEKKKTLSTQKILKDGYAFLTVEHAEYQNRGEKVQRLIAWDDQTVQARVLCTVSPPFDHESRAFIIQENYEHFIEQLHSEHTDLTECDWKLREGVAHAGT